MAVKRPVIAHGRKLVRPRAGTAAPKKRSPLRAKKKGRRAAGSASPIASLDVQEIESLRAELDRLAAGPSPNRWNADPEDVRRSVAKLVLTLVELIRQVLERQAIRRMEAGTLTDVQTESVGLALMRLEETVRDLGSQFGLAPEDLTIDLGPIGKLT